MPSVADARRRSRLRLVLIAAAILLGLGGIATALVAQHASRPAAAPHAQPVVAPGSPTARSAEAQAQALDRALDRARAAARSARRELTAAIAEATTTLGESEGKVADDAVRRKLHRALDAAADQRRADGVTLDELQEAAARRTATRDTLVEATQDVRTAVRAWQAERDRDAAESEAREDAEADAEAEALAEGWHDAESAARCSAPDQVWTPENGHLPDAALAAVPWSPGHRVRVDVLDGLVDLDAAFRDRFGRHLKLTSSYRTHAEQEALHDPGSDTAAPPGCSNHGTGLAVDVGGGVERFGSTEHEWLQANAEAFGWVHPPFAEPAGRNPEPWHWQSVLAPNSF